MARRTNVSPRAPHLSLALLFTLCLLLASSSGAAWAAPVLVSQAYLIPTAGAAHDVLHRSTAMHVSIVVGCTRGAVEVMDATGSSTPLGTVNAGETEVFEGTWKHVLVRACDADSAGTYVVRGPVDASPTTPALGGGSVKLTQSGLRVFKSAEVGPRLISVRSSSGIVSVRTSRTGERHIDIAAGNSSFLYASTSEFWLVGKGSAAFEVLAFGRGLSIPGGKWTPKAEGTQETKLELPGTACISGSIKNTGEGVLRVTVTYVGLDNPVMLEVLPGNSTPVLCTVRKIETNFDEADGEAEYVGFTVISDNT